MPNTAICNYVRRREVITFSYDSTQRTVEPHLVGYDANGDLTLSGWQTAGPTPSGWRDFHVGKMKSISSTGRVFRRARPGYNQNDTTISEILCRISSASKKTRSKK